MKSASRLEQPSTFFTMNCLLCSRTELGIVRRDYEAISMLSDRGVATDQERNIQFVWLLEYETFQSLRAEGFKIGLILVQLVLTLVLYRELVRGPFILAFIVSALMFGIALRARNQ